MPVTGIDIFALDEPEASTPPVQHLSKSETSFSSTQTEPTMLPASLTICHFVFALWTSLNLVIYFPFYLTLPYLINFSAIPKLFFRCLNNGSPGTSFTLFAATKVFGPRRT